MDVTLVTALRDLLETPASVAIYRCVGEPGQQRWLTRARLRVEDTVATADSLWVDPDTLPRLDDVPRRLQSLKERAVIQDREGSQWVTYFPLATERDVIGVLELHTASRPRPASQRLVTSVLRIYHNFQGLLDYSERDTLTGLLNRKTFDESFLKAVSELPLRASAAQDERRQAEVHPRYWLGVLDIDHFKSINDRFGHLIGDEVLLLLSRLMRSTFRFNDLLYRFGGEEFVVLMRCENEEDAAQAFERFRHNTEHYAFPQVGRITVSIGFTQIRAGDSPAGAFERADKAVYHAKGAGRNQVQSHATLIAQGQMSEATHLSDVELF
ncbi:diguanylate cyclase (GGDEF) domain-containing protein [Roseateles sp. YR242]|uniref:GGDEF domain-containing protein n=1 Tax=Roseateles sp. YR242 TaxID=1855305 RepID=UPI0008AA8DCD|nr:GGDEF domain-containing protein [Roseateles sp. YR242]SEK59569.1 diguanylate cyclase (GGDEF) domain-containing protein [Roseateles sp. YR242]